jgi:hypothetical protein
MTDMHFWAEHQNGKWMFIALPSYMDVKSSLVTFHGAPSTTSSTHRIDKTWLAIWDLMLFRYELACPF